eukprot:TRINITY_DN390_c0_g1_i1.p1 TRINITY_DN390_c0_g1~~TRINITY_DN390_c0_g1_i1.p1  ORF type:complete len:239 (+),score=79.13 TRINITY_DN390_c0_g1_i1:96-719(+)
MSRKKMSMDEKRVKLKELFQETKDVFVLKEVEKKGSKQKGIVLQTVKDVLQALVDDGLVCSDKIGTSNYFWSFPSQNLIMLNNKVEEMKKEVENLKRNRDQLDNDIQAAGVGREPTEQRTTKLAKLEALQNQNAQLKTELERYAEFDPRALEVMTEEAKKAVTAANRWTDNIFQTVSYMENKHNFEKSAIMQNFNIPEELEYLEDTK